MIPIPKIIMPTDEICTILPYFNLKGSIREGALTWPAISKPLMPADGDLHNFAYSNWRAVTGPAIPKLITPADEICANLLHLHSQWQTESFSKSALIFTVSFWNESLFTGWQKECSSSLMTVNLYLTVRRNSKIQDPGWEISNKTS